MARTGSFLTVRLIDPPETKDSLSTAPRVCHLENMSLLAGVEPPEGSRTFDPSREDGN